MSHTRSSFVPDLIFFLAALFFVTPVTAQTVDVPVRLESGFIQRLLQEQLFTEPGAVARVWDDGRDCNHLQLSAAQTFLEADGRLRTRSAASARVGTVLAGICLPLFNWQGYVEIFQQPLLGETPGRVDFEVVDSRVFRDEQATGAVGTIWDWIKLYVHPRFGRLHVDLQPLLQDLGSFLAIVLPGQAIATQQLVDSVRLSSVAITDQRLELGVRFELPVTGADAITAADTVETPLSDAELARWHAGWQHWDAFLTMVIKHAGADTLVPELRADLFAVLLDARHDPRYVP